MRETTDEGWNPESLVILALITLSYMYKTKGQVCDS